MKKVILSTSLILTLLLGGCGTSDDEKMDPNMDHSKMDMNQSDSDK